MYNNTNKSPCGKFNVMLPLTLSPYFKYPKNPTAVYKQATITIPVFNTPFHPPKSWGVFILFSNGKTYSYDRLIFLKLFQIKNVRYLQHRFLRRHK